MGAVLQNAKTPEQSAHEKIQNCREKINELKQARYFSFIFPEEDSLDNSLFTWDELSDKENVTKIKSLYKESIIQAQKYRTDFNIIYEYADLLRYNREYLPAFNLFRKLEAYYQQSETSPSDYVALYARMQICCEKTYGEVFSLQYVRKVWEFGLKLENESPSEKLMVVSRSLFHTVDLDWQKGGLEDDLTLLQHTLELIEQMDEEHLSACRELKAIVIGYIAVCKVFRDEDKDCHCSLTALDLFQTILKAGADFKWTLDTAACCKRLSTILKTHGDKGWALIAAELQCEVLKQAADSQLSQYGPEYLYACDSLATIWMADDSKHALEFCRSAMDIRLRLAHAGIKTFMQRKTVQSFVPAVLPPLRGYYEKLISAQLNAHCGSLEETVAEDEKYEQAIEAIEYTESTGNENK